MRLIKKYYYDVDNNYLVASNSSSTELKTKEVMFKNNGHIVQMELLSNSVGQDVSDIVTWSANYGSPNNSFSNVSNSVFNLVADWSNVDPSEGKICFELDLGADVNTDLGNYTKKTHYLQVNGIDGDGDNRTLSLIPISTYNSIFDIEDFNLNLIIDQPQGGLWVNHVVSPDYGYASTGTWTDGVWQYDAMYKNAMFTTNFLKPIIEGDYYTINVNVTVSGRDVETISALSARLYGNGNWVRWDISGNGTFDLTETIRHTGETENDQDGLCLICGGPYPATGPLVMVINHVELIPL